MLLKARFTVINREALELAASFTEVNGNAFTLSLLGTETNSLPSGRISRYGGTITAEDNQRQLDSLIPEGETAQVTTSSAGIGHVRTRLKLLLRLLSSIIGAGNQYTRNWH